MTGNFPFNNPQKCKKTLYKQILAQEFKSNEDLSIEEEWLLGKMLSKQIEERIDLPSVLNFLDQLIN